MALWIWGAVLFVIGLILIIIAAAWWVDTLRNNPKNQANAATGFVVLNTIGYILLTIGVVLFVIGLITRSAINKAKDIIYSSEDYLLDSFPRETDITLTAGSVPA